MKKTDNKGKNSFNIFKKVTNERNTFLALTNSKIKISSKFKKQMMI
jgi:hypothetical protein